jgi:hypothetical protein
MPRSSGYGDVGYGHLVIDWWLVAIEMCTIEHWDTTVVVLKNDQLLPWKTETDHVKWHETR